MIKSLSKIHPAPPPFLDHDYPFIKQQGQFLVWIN
jgi:hypothetical protein